MKALLGAFNQEKALVGAFSVIVKSIVKPMDRFTALLTGYSRYKLIGSDDESKWQEYFDVNLFSLSSPVCHLSEQRPGEVVK